MFTTPESSSGAVATATSIEALRRQGPKGLWGALAGVSTPTIEERQLPLADAATMGLGTSLFSYDRSQAVDLDGEPLGGPTLDLDDLLLD